MTLFVFYFKYFQYRIIQGNMYSHNEYNGGTTINFLLSNISILKEKGVSSKEVCNKIYSKLEKSKCLNQEDLMLLKSALEKQYSFIFYHQKEKILDLLEVKIDELHQDCNNDLVIQGDFYE